MGKKKTKRPTGRERIEFETFRQLGGYEQNSLTHDEPSCFNGFVNVRKMRVIFEPVEESDDVIYERLLKLWRECDNHHHWGPLKAVAASIGRELPHDEFGIDRKGR